MKTVAASILIAALGAILALPAMPEAQTLSPGAPTLSPTGPTPLPGAAGTSAEPGMADTDLLEPPDQGFLLTMEAWQRRIAVLTLALQAAELEVRRAEQERRLRELQVETDSIDILATAGLGGAEAALTNLPPMLQGNLEAVRAAQAAARQEPEMPQAEPIMVRKIRGVADDLVATVATGSGDVVRVRAGDFLPDGRGVMAVNPTSISVRELTGRTVAYGLGGG